MGYKQLIDSKVNLAFNLLKDLAVEAVLTKKTGQTFDFANLAVAATDTNLTVKVIEAEAKKPVAIAPKTPVKATGSSASSGQCAENDPKGVMTRQDSMA